MQAATCSRQAGLRRGGGSQPELLLTHQPLLLQIYDCRLPLAGKQGTGVLQYTYETAINSYLHYMHGQRAFFINQVSLCI